MKVIFCGRGPSSSLHLGHILLYTKIADYALKNKLPIIFQFSDDEKLYRDGNSLKFYDLQIKRDLNILSFIFKGNKVFFFSSRTDLDYRLIFNRQLKRVKLNYFLPLFQVKGTDNITSLIYPLVQATLPIFFKECGISEIEVITSKDQESYFKLTKKLGGPEFTFTEVASLPSINMKEKMTSSDNKNCIFLEDSLKQIREKVNSSSSGAYSSILEHTNKGLRDPSIDFCYCYLLLVGKREIAESYKKGNLTTLSIKEVVLRDISDRINNLKNYNGNIIKKRKMTKINLKKWIQT